MRPVEANEGFGKYWTLPDPARGAIRLPGRAALVHT